MTTREGVLLQLLEALPALPDGWWQTGPQRTEPLRRVAQALTGIVNRGAPAAEYVVEARFIERGGHPSSEHVLVGTGPDEVAALQDLLARVKTRYPQEGLEAGLA